MPRPDYRYPWPASAITSKDMALLHGVRESSDKRVPISVLVAAAVRACYGRSPVPIPPPTPPEPRDKRKRTHEL